MSKRRLDPAHDQVPWSSLFYGPTWARNIFSLRPSAGEANHKRFWAMCSQLGVPHHVEAHVFGSKLEYYAFLDGGVSHYWGYGWGSHRVTSIIGWKALRLVCGRLGLTPPRRFRYEPNKPEIQALEQELAAQRADPNRPLDDLLDALQNRLQSLVVERHEPVPSSTGV